MVRFSTWSSLLLALLLTAGSALAQERHPGQTKYMQLCAPCHGTTLTGGDGPNLIDDEHKYGGERSDIARSIVEGNITGGMPPFGGALTDQEVNDIIDFIMFRAERIAARTAPPEASPAPSNSEVVAQLETLDYSVAAEAFVSGLEVPWAIDFLDAHTALVTERPGRLRMVVDGQLNPEPVAGTPDVLNARQGGLLDVAVDPNYANNGWIYLAYSHALPGTGGGDPMAMTRIVRGKIVNHTWTDEEVVYEASPESYSPMQIHYGSRIVFDKKGYLYFSVGDRFAQDQAQEISRPNGKIHRIYPDGSIPEDNPFITYEGAVPSIYSYGHRNPQGLAVHPETDEIWDAEHGPRGGDELNRVVAGRNYGWPVISYGINYNGTTLTEYRHRPGMEQPNLYWKPSIAVSGLDFYDGDLFPRWKNKLIVGSLAFQELHLLDIHGTQVMHDEVVMKDLGRIREAVVGPDGAIYVVQNDPGRILRLVPTETKP